jgi:hypothetical protein
MDYEKLETFIQCTHTKQQMCVHWPFALFWWSYAWYVWYNFHLLTKLEQKYAKFLDNVLWLNWQSINNHDIRRFETLYIVFCVEKILKLQILWNLHFWNLQWSCFLFLGVDWIVEMEHARLFTCGEHPHVKIHVQPRNLS